MAHLRAHDFSRAVHREVDCDARFAQERTFGGDEPEVLKDRRLVHQSLGFREHRDYMWIDSGEGGGVGNYVPYGTIGTTNT